MTQSDPQAPSTENGALNETAKAEAFDSKSDLIPEVEPVESTEEEISATQPAVEIPEDEEGEPAVLALPSHLDEDVDSPTHVVAIGASAGGLEALERFFRAMPTESGMAFVVIQHLSPDFKSLMDELLERFNQMPVKVVRDTAIIKANHIYLLQPSKELTINGKNWLVVNAVGKGLYFYRLIFSFVR